MSELHGLQCGQQKANEVLLNFSFLENGITFLKIDIFFACKQNYALLFGILNKLSVVFLKTLFTFRRPPCVATSKLNYQ